MDKTKFKKVQVLVKKYLPLETEFGDYGKKVFCNGLKCEDCVLLGELHRIENCLEKQKVELEKLRK